MNEHGLAVVICNYNKKEYLRTNLRSLSAQTVSDFDIYVVDNASEDGSADMVKQEFSDKARVIRNPINLGGSGGFNVGMREAMKKPYEFLILLDNDVTLKEDCVEVLRRDMRLNPDIGIMGAKILRMDKPDIIQDFAPTINYNDLSFALDHTGEKDCSTFPHLADCEYVAACGLIVRRSVIERIGYFPEENFIYFDDVTWNIRCRRAGMRVVSNSQAVLWHKGGYLDDSDTFVTYYSIRNKLRFFMTYDCAKAPDNSKVPDRERRIFFILRDVFEGIYVGEWKGLTSSVRTRMDAFLDAIFGVSGKAEAYKIRMRKKVPDALENAVRQAKSITLYENGFPESAGRILTRIEAIIRHVGGTARTEIIEGRGDAFSNPPRFIYDENGNLILHACKHICRLDIDCFERFWVDEWGNVILSESDYLKCREYPAAFRRFRMLFEDRIRDCMEQIGGDYSSVRRT